MITITNSPVRRLASSRHRRHCQSSEFGSADQHYSRKTHADTSRSPTTPKVSMQSVTVSLQLLLFTDAANSKPMGFVIALQTVTKGFSRRAAALLEKK